MTGLLFPLNNGVLDDVSYSVLEQLVRSAQYEREYNWSNNKIKKETDKILNMFDHKNTDAFVFTFNGETHIIYNQNKINEAQAKKLLVS